jgi:hypothetical protein
MRDRAGTADPATLGMTLLDGRAYECWGQPDSAQAKGGGDE